MPAGIGFGQRPSSRRKKMKGYLLGQMLGQFLIQKVDNRLPYIRKPLILWRPKGDEDGHQWVEVLTLP
jgi:hypothetical protein